MEMTSVMNPVRQVCVNGEMVEVREFRALEFLGIFKQFNAHLQKVADKEGNLRLTAQNFADVVLGTEELFTVIATKATGRDVKWLETLSLGEALDLLAAVFELNREVLAKKLGALTTAFRGMTQS